MPSSKSLEERAHGTRHHEPISAASIQTLCYQCLHDPQAFFKPWSLLVEDIENSQHGNVAIEASPGSYGSEDSIRLIFHALLFHDMVLGQSGRRKLDAKLPRGRGLKILVQHAWRMLTGKALSAPITEKLIDYVKVGNMCDLIGASIGEISWFLFPLYILERKRFLNNKQLVVLKSKIRHQNLLDQAAKNVREFQLSQRCPLIPKRKYLHGMHGTTRRLKPLTVEPVRYQAEDTSTNTKNGPSSPTRVALIDDLDPLPSDLWDNIFCTPPKPMHWNNNLLYSALQPLPSEKWDYLFHHPPPQSGCPNDDPLPNTLLVPHEVWDTLFISPQDESMQPLHPARKYASLSSNYLPPRKTQHPL
ncbi:hypothetical protein CC86DRAFT_182919 [Ophiobolus disseminans]|uniref:Uncharacterized protein n=1 Tax=Ophiobolus disseminans TaxID=1469910 RepID=A0A6A6ZCM9_9PLEO|nr:hypothetical protein CC86DRAFT_182919 [Ophiobolus disseminans]